MGAVAKIIDDPTNSGRGKVLKGTITGNAVDQGGYLAHRAHPGKSFPAQTFPCRVQEDIWMSKQVYEDVIEGRGNWYSQLSLFAKMGQGGRVLVTTSLINESSWTGYGLGITGYMTLDIHDIDPSIQSFTKILPDAPRFTPEEWHTMAVELDPDGMVYLYQDNQLVTKGELINYPQKVLRNAHGGPIYGGPSFSNGGYVLVDNFSVVCWP
jgi:hypothetical protein